ncbi:FAD:protein FMN transferase [Alicyclobacillus sp. SO9]|uniref:FAD:protein FMN transferase n=1 Tax=Alicyclobacillus sp. SO9 TaxID=2665646 RepID=UPI0018E7BBBF|nr:FAD:protein FMN transferase [Alicyclobacillus sp. SO9]QQE81038.1 FAD:protein FMN transferase [Alicyclobacillus sp. SO9]
MRHRVESELCMGTTVTIHVVSSETDSIVARYIDSAFALFREVEQQCSRFDPDSPLRQLSHTVGKPVQVPEHLFNAVNFAVAMAAITDGVFTPTIGRNMEEHGFNRNYITGETVSWTGLVNTDANYQDIILNEEQRTITLMRPLLLDVGAVAKGLAVDLAARTLMNFPGFSIDAGGDVFVHGVDEDEKPWRLGIKHPLHPDDSICSLHAINDAAVCTSGSYYRISPSNPRVHHLLNPMKNRDDKGPETVSCTVIAPYAMMADAFSTAAFLLGKGQGIDLLEQNGLNGLIITSGLETYLTDKMEDFIYEFYK